MSESNVSNNSANTAENTQAQSKTNQENKPKDGSAPSGSEQSTNKRDGSGQSESSGSKENTSKINNTDRDNVSLKSKAGSAALGAAKMGASALNSAKNGIKGGVNEAASDGEASDVVNGSMSSAAGKALDLGKSVGKKGIDAAKGIHNKIKEKGLGKGGGAGKAMDGAKKIAKAPAKAANTAKKAVKTVKAIVAALKAILAALQAIISAIIAAILPWLWAIAIVVAVAGIGAWLSKQTKDVQQGIDSREEKTVQIANMSSEVSKTWISLFYQRFSDAMFYAQVEHPDDGEKDSVTELTFEEIAGFPLSEIEEDVLYQGDSEFLRTHNIRDFENHETQLVLSWAALQQLDDKLNSPYIYPEQFIKPLYASCTKDGFEAFYDEGKELEECKLLDDAGELLLKTAMSTKYNYDDTTTSEDDVQLKLGEMNTGMSMWKKAGGTTRGNWDWGLGSIIKYKAFYQSSQIENMKVAKIIGWDDATRGLKEIDNPTSADYSKYEPYDFFVPEQTITYKDLYDTGNGALAKSEAAAVERNQVANFQALLQVFTPKFLRSQVDAEGQSRVNAIYSDDIDQPGDKKDWWKYEPGNTTQIPDPKIVYGIEYALTPFGAMTIHLNQEWVEVAETEATQYFPYVAFVNDHPDIGPEDPVPDACNGLCNAMIRVEGYKIISKGGTNVSQFKASSKTSGKLQETVSQSDKAYGASQGFWYNPEVRTIQAHSNTVDYTVGSFDCQVGTPVLASDGVSVVCALGDVNNPSGYEAPTFVGTSHTYQCEAQAPCGDLPNDEVRSLCGCQTWQKGYYEEGETNANNVYPGEASEYTFGAMYKMTLKSIKKGSLMTNLVYYEDDQPESDDVVGVDYIREYIDHYQAMIPVKPDVSTVFRCYSANGNPVESEGGFYTLESMKNVSPNW